MHFCNAWRTRLMCVLTLAGLGITAVAPVRAQLDPYYVTDGFNTNTIYVLQHGNIVNSFPDAVGNEYGIAVQNDVRTTGYLGGPGAQYTLGGAFTGTTYPSNNGNTFDG